MNETLKKIAKFLWATFLITFPFSLRWVIYETTSYRFGHFNPWVTGFFYLPEILLWGAFIITFYLSSRVKSVGASVEADGVEGPPKSLTLPFLAIVLFLINATLFTTLNGSLAHLFLFFLRLAEAGMIWYLLKSNLFPFKRIIHFLLIGALFQIVLGALQLILNRSIGLWFLGESVLGPEVYNVAKNDLAEGAKRIRPYGTFLHANIFAGYLLAILFLSLPHLKKSARLLWPLLLAIMIIFTGSQAALLVMILGFALMFVFALLKDFKRIRLIVISIFAVFLIGNGWLFFKSGSIELKNPSWQERLMLVDISQEMLSKKPSGVGFRQFTLNMEQFSDQKLLPWEFQPVHNAYILIMNELGIQGLLLILLLIGWLIYKQFFPKTYSRKDKLDSLSKMSTFLPFFLLLILATFDHFLWDSFAGWIVLAIGTSLFYISIRQKKPSKAPKK